MLWRPSGSITLNEHNRVGYTDCMRRRHGQNGTGAWRGARLGGQGSRRGGSHQRFYSRLFQVAIAGGPEVYASLVQQTIINSWKYPRKGNLPPYIHSFSPIRIRVPGGTYVTGSPHPLRR